MKRPLDNIETASTTTTTTDSSDTTNKNNNSYSSSPPHKSQRMGSSLVCPKHDNQKTSKMNEDHSDNDQVEQMDAIATGEGTNVM
jgi:anti-sigma28 factor (negative regulator of flagellin synthesis)